MVVVKTFVGLKFHAAILKYIADRNGAKWRLAKPEEESRGIDGYIGETPVSIKPSSYKSKGTLPESIPCKVIYYEKLKDGIEIEFEDVP